MSGLDMWGDINCPKCNKKTLHIWFFDTDCRYNDSSKGGDCKSCGFTPDEVRLSEMLREFRKNRYKK